MPKIAFVDTYYPEALASWHLTTSSYETRLKEIMARLFGTSDYYSNAFRAYGWDAIDIVANDVVGVDLWRNEHACSLRGCVSVVLEMLQRFQPDVVYCQNLTFFTPQQLRSIPAKVFTGQISSAWPGDDYIKAFDLLFTSFPFYPARFEALGVRGRFLQIAFGGDEVLKSLQYRPAQRDIDVAFVGGVGPIWRQGTATLSYLAQQVPTFRWGGYGLEYIPKGALREAYVGPVWGIDMYKMYARAKIVVNRHGEVFQGFSNNMRLFEATGCGALLITEATPNLSEYFAPGEECATYTTPEELVAKVTFYLSHPELLDCVAVCGRAHTLDSHVYIHVLKFAEAEIRKLLEEKSR